MSPGRARWANDPRPESARRQRRHYHFDWTVVPENLLKWVHWRQDSEGEDLELCAFRDRDGREVEFVVSEQMTPRLLVQCRWSDARVSKSLRYLHRKFPGADAWQISAVGRKDIQTADGIRVAPALQLLRNLI